MRWDFEAEPEFTGELVWIDQFPEKGRGALRPSAKAEIIAHPGATEQKTRYLATLLNYKRVSAVAITEHYAGPTDATAALAETAEVEAVEAA